MFTLSIAVNPANIETIKLALTRALPRVKSSHRCEAIARGLGFRTYASLLEELRSGRGTVAIADGAAFRKYLTSHDFNVGSPPFYRAVGWAALKFVADAYPRITDHGIGVGPPERFGGNWQTAADHRARFAEGRSDLVSEGSVEPFLLSLAFVQRVERTKTVRPATNSYWLKHIAENYACTYPEGEELGPQYVPNGVLIAAAMQAGFQLKTFMDDYGYESLNAGFNMSKTSLYDLDCEIRPNGARAHSRRERERQRSQKGYNVLY
ncbi:MAG TPA: hypothetical protein VF727_10205 [Allosphingosinicella sp.]